MTGGVAVILGSTGRNLGAGMSGGVAYVYKLRADRVNPEALATNELKLSALETSDTQKLRQLLESYVAETDSNLAKRILADFDTEISHFVRVLPRDYANVLAIRAKAKSASIDPDSEDVWQEILEVTNG
jgi:glutamate synthase (NADPH/NADH) large chain